MSKFIHIVSHTHWDREWYLPFQVFRLKLISLVDNLLNILEDDPEYRYFTLDGQTIILDDYLELRPGKVGLLRRYIQEGRLLIGPWHILPDEFLVSPEATIRNLLLGERTAREYGEKMNIGYLPDQFGHIGQMPQILIGFGIQTAVVWRGLAHEPNEFWWEAPDGSRVFTLYLRNGYSNAASLPLENVDRFINEILLKRDALASHAASEHILLMHGNDHMEPDAGISKAIPASQNNIGGDVIIHSSLPKYFSAVRTSIETSKKIVPTIRGELRNPECHHLLPGVLSARMWIKQRNYYSQILLERWVEPFTTWVNLLVADGVTAGVGEKLKVALASSIDNPKSIIHYVWRKLMENHPHDSICGCSIDQVHNEMQCRFDQVDQIAEALIHQALTTLARAVDTRFPDGLNRGLNSDQKTSLVVFNPLATVRTDVVTFNLQGAVAVGDVQIIDETGKSLPHTEWKSTSREITSMSLDRDGLREVLNIIANGRVGGMVLHNVGFHRQADMNKGIINLILSDSGEPSRDALKFGADGIEQFLSDDALFSFDVRVQTSAEKTVQFVANDVPACGYRTFWLRSVIPGFDSRSHDTYIIDETAQNGLEHEIQNRYMRVIANPANGTLTVIDKNTGTVFEQLNYYEDGGDAGDEYNYSPPEKDTTVTSDQATIHSIRVLNAPHLQSLEIQLTLPVPESLIENRCHRAKKTVSLKISTVATLYNDISRLDIMTKVFNPAQDHRLRVHFPLPFKAKYANYDGHYEVIKRAITLPIYDGSWIEQPRLEVPQRAFVDVSDAGVGLMIANRGLPEVAVLPDEGDKTVIALTLLRCVGWLSRGDLSTRKGHAGPMLPTPQAQMLGEYKFEYSVIPHMKDWQHAYQQAYEFNAGMRGISIDIHEGCLPFALTFIKIDPDDFILSAVKTTEDDSGWLIRGYNPRDDSFLVRLKPYRHFTSASRVNLAEQELSPLYLNADGSVEFSVNPHEITTIKFS